MNSETNMNNRVNTLTYCTWSSIGSVLQAYALSETLKSFGYQEILWLEDWSRTYGRRKARGIKDHIKLLYERLYEKKVKSAHEKRTAFIEEHLETKYFLNAEDYKAEAQKTDGGIYLAGSDQIWNPVLCRSVYFLDFVPENSKKTTYAVSMGNTDVPTENHDRFKELVSSFDSISVREKDCARVIEKISGKETRVHIDPTFLVDCKDWRRIQKEYNVKEKYILLYMLYWEDSLAEKVKALRKKTGLKIYAITSGPSRVYADKYLIDVGIEEFLWLVDNAEYVVTSSFHGVALSTVFNKKFSAVNNPKLPSRIENLMTTLAVPTVDIEMLSEAEDFDYDSINANILKQRERSIEYLKSVLK